MKLKHAHGAKSRHMKFAAASLLAATLLGGSLLNANKAYANAVNDYVKQGLSQKHWTPAKEENRLGGIKYRNNYLNGKGRPTMVINHDTANPNSTIDGEIAYMTRNQESAFVHEFVDGNRMIGIADTDYISWGSGPQGNSRGVQVEQVHVHSKDEFARELMNLAQFNVNIMKQYGLTPSIGKANGSGSIWTHAMVSRYLGGTDHVDPDGYWAKNASQWFGTTYTINDFASLVSDVYYGRTQANAPAKIQASTKVRQDGGNFIADVTVSGDTSRITEVQVPTWSDSRQKDLKWYTARKINANTFRVVIPTSNHKSTGTYSFHTYVRSNDGKFTFKNANQLKYITNGVTGKTQLKLINGKLVITTTLSGDVGRVTQVHVPTWMDKNKKDIQWYPMVKKSNNVYEYQVDVTNKNYGVINTYVYTTSDGWQDKTITTNGFKFESPKVTGVTKVNVTADTIEVTAKLTGDTSRVKTVSFPTWHDPAQKDLRWYPATKLTDTDYKLSIPLRDYNKAAGNYITHSYIKTAEGKNQSFAANTYTYSGVVKPEVKPQVKPSEVTVAKTGTTDKLGVIKISSTDANMYQGNPPLTKNGGKVVDKATSRTGQTFRVLRETTLSNGDVYSYGLFGDKHYYWLLSNNLVDVVKTPIIDTDVKLETPKVYGAINRNAVDIWQDDPRYRVVSPYRDYNRVIASNSAKSANVQLTRKMTYKDGSGWYEFTQSNKNGQSMGWVSDKYVTVK